MQNPQPVENFYLNPKTKDGLNHSCKNCKKIYEDRYRLTHKKEITVRSKKQRENNPSYHKKWVNDNKEKHSKIQKKSKDKNREKIRKKELEYYYKNREKLLALAKKRREENPERERRKGKKFREENRGISNARIARRRAIKMRAMPNWITKAQKEEIKKVYIEAVRLSKESGISRHVDHIIPLQGENVSGLHVPWNLQILTAKENESKNNKIKEEDLESHKNFIIKISKIVI